jgi:hypothetical protein
MLFGAYSIQKDNKTISKLKPEDLTDECKLFLKHESHEVGTIRGCLTNIQKVINETKETIISSFGDVQMYTDDALESMKVMNFTAKNLKDANESLKELKDMVNWIEVNKALLEDLEM